MTHSWCYTDGFRISNYDTFKFGPQIPLKLSLLMKNLYGIYYTKYIKGNTVEKAMDYTHYKWCSCQAKEFVSKFLKTNKFKQSVAPIPQLIKGYVLGSLS